MPASAKANATGNRLLDRLAEPEFARLALHLEPVALAVKQRLYRVDEPIHHVYFPTSGMISLVLHLEEGKEVEAATVGNEGLVGLSVALGLDFSPHAAKCQLPFEGLRMAVRPFVQVPRDSSALGTLLDQYTAITLRHANQAVACNLYHPVERRLCRWLLMTQDWAGADVFPLPGPTPGRPGCA